MVDQRAQLYRSRIGQRVDLGGGLLTGLERDLADHPREVLTLVGVE